MQDDVLAANRASWNNAAPVFCGRGITDHGGFGIGQDFPDLLGPIADRTFVEIGCGSGHSIAYLIARGAAHVVGIDFSDTQIATARDLNAAAIRAGRVTLLHAPMEHRASLDPVDTVFSAYAIGWTTDPDQTFAHIFTYLKPGGRFVWSWQHPFHYLIQHNGQAFVVTRSYFDEAEHVFSEWQHEPPIHYTNRRLSTWFRVLRQAGFHVLDLIEPAPETFPPSRDDPARFTSNPKARLIPPSMIWVCQKPKTA